MSRPMVGSTIALLLVSGRASAFDLSGAWASDRSLCNHVFNKKGNTVTFAEMSDLYGSGFIVDGDVIQGSREIADWAEANPPVAASAG